MPSDWRVAKTASLAWGAGLALVRWGRRAWGGAAHTPLPDMSWAGSLYRGLGLAAAACVDGGGNGQASFSLAQVSRSTGGSEAGGT